jgi:hypothetical protein
MVEWPDENAIVGEPHRNADWVTWFAINGAIPTRHFATTFAQRYFRLLGLIAMP